MNLSQIVTSSRVELLDPRPQRPSFRYLLQLAVARVQNAYNVAHNTHRAWDVDETTLDVVAGFDEYSIGANVGRILDVVYSDPLNVEGTERQIPFFDLTDLRGDYREWDTVAAGIAFYYKQGQLYARVRPIPQETKSYSLIFTPGSWADGAVLSDEPFLLAHHHYFVCGTALDALPACEWFDEEKDKGPERNAARRGSLERSLLRRTAEYGKQFELGIASLTVPRVTQLTEAFPIE